MKNETARPRDAGLERAFFVSLAVLAFCLPLSIALANAAAGAALLLFIPVYARRKSSFTSTGLELPWLVFAGWEVFTALISARPLHSFKKTASEYLILFFVLPAQGAAPAWISALLGSYLAGAALAGALGVFQRIAGPALATWAAGAPQTLARLMTGHAGRAAGFYDHPITYAEMLLTAFFPALFWALGSDRKARRSLAAAALLAGGILASGTRGVWLALFAAMTGWALWKREKRLLAAAALLALLGAGAAAVSPSILARVRSVADVQTNDSNKIRLGIWDRSLEIIARHPIAGVGIGNLHIPAEDLRWGGAKPGSDWTETHNAYLQMAVERGLPGLALFLWLAWSMGRLLSRARPAATWAEGFLAGFCGLLAAGLTESWTHDSEVMMGLYFVLGLAAAAAKNIKIGDTK